MREAEREAEMEAEMEAEREAERVWTGREGRGGMGTRENEVSGGA